MTIPNPDFYFIVNGLTVNFYDLSINLPTGWDWNFGDATTSTSQNPPKTYTAAGTYTVRLTASNADGAQDIVKILYVSVTVPTFGISIDDFVRMNLPSTLPLLPSIIPNLKKKWQLLLQAAVRPEILPADTYVEAAWPDEWNMLIAYCIVYDILMILSQEAFIGNLGLSSSADSGASNVSTGSGGLKRLVEGPSEAEWFDLSKSMGNLFKANADGSTAFSAITGQACMLAGKLGVKLPWCPNRKSMIPIPIIGKNPYRPYSEEQWIE